MSFRLRVIRAGACLVMLAAGLTASAANPSEAAGLERIKSFDSTIMVMPDGDIVVRETIAVHAEGIEIKHGIYRQFPTRSLNYRGIPVYPGFQILQVAVNGEEAPHFMKENEDGKAIYIGRADTIIPPGDYTYVVAYRLESQIERHADHDEFIWSVNGDWTLPIDLLTACVHIAGASAEDILVVEAWIEGSADGDVRTAVGADGAVEIAVHRALRPEESLDIHLSWRLKGDQKVFPDVVFQDAEPGNVD